MANEQKILSFGSLNMDTVFSVPYIVKPGETLSSRGIGSYVGGKGLNQSIALSQAGSTVYHAGAVGEEDGTSLIETLQSYNINTDNVICKPGKSGNAFIQVDDNGQNSILLYDGANKQLTLDEIHQVLDQFDEGDVIVLQNEINLIKEIIEEAGKRGLIIFFNPSPLEENLLLCDLQQVDWFIMNEIEAAQLLNESEYHSDTLQKLIANYPRANFVITLGTEGSICYSKGTFYTQGVHKVTAVDTTGAGDTFTGYFISVLNRTDDIKEALSKASIASGLSVTQKGASNSIPIYEEVEKVYLNNQTHK